MSSKVLRIISADDSERERELSRLCRRSEAISPAVEESARRILDDVRLRGDDAIRELTLRFEGRQLDGLELERDEWEREADRVSPEMARILERAHARIRRFHEAEADGLRGVPFVLSDEESVPATLRLAVRPLHRVGLYAPGGTARYPSTVLMTAVPARVAGVRELLLVTPGPSPETLHAARIAGVDRVFRIGGAQAVGALAYGTKSVPRVDKIVGPGNAWVAAAKRLVFGDVAIDQVAGPSEVLIAADEFADPRLVAADLLAQAEHDTEAWAVLVTTSAALAAQTAVEVERQLSSLPRAEIAARAIADHGAAVVVSSLAELDAFTNRFAPEHLGLHLRDCDETHATERFENAGAIFVGAYTPEAVGDYFAGPNHVLPTSGSARFSSPLGVHDFLKRTSVVRYSDAALRFQAADIVRFAEAEGLHAHGRAVAFRVEEQARESEPAGAAATGAGGGS